MVNVVRLVCISCLRKMHLIKLADRIDQHLSLSLNASYVSDQVKIAANVQHQAMVSIGTKLIRIFQ